MKIRFIVDIPLFDAPEGAVSLRFAKSISHQETAGKRYFEGACESRFALSLPKDYPMPIALQG